MKIDSQSRKRGESKRTWIEVEMTKNRFKEVQATRRFGPRQNGKTYFI